MALNDTSIQINQMIKERVALVTGASRGIGRALAQGLASEGFKVAIVARSDEELKKLAAEVDRVSESLVCSIDISDDRLVKDAVASILRKWGRVDVLVNNAGIFELGSLDVAASSLDRLYQINLKAPFCFMQEVLPVMRKQKSGYIFNIASVSGIEGYAGYGAYASSKFALVGLNEAIFKEISKEGIKITAICPSWVDTAMAQEANLPMTGDLMIQPGDIMKTVLWLMSLSSSACVSKVVINCSSTVT